MDMDQVMRVVLMVVDLDLAVPLTALTEGTEDTMEDTADHTEAVVESED
jgi:hypothetical protein